LIARLHADARAIPILLALVGVCGIVASSNATFVQAATYAGIYAIAAIGLSLLLGSVNQISLGQAAFFGIGAYAVAYLTTSANWSYWPALVVGVVLAAFFGVVIGFIALRFHGHYLAMATLAFNLICVGIFHQWKLIGGAVGINNIPFAQLGPIRIAGTPAFWFAWIAAAIVALLSLRLLRGRMGYAFEAIRNDELAAEVTGVPTRRCKIVAFTYAGALAGLSGAMYVAVIGLMAPDIPGVGLTVDLLLMVVLGGMGSVSGAIIGACFIGFLSITGHSFDNWREVAYGVVVIAVVVAAPGGLFGLIRGRARTRATDRAPAPRIESVMAPLVLHSNELPLVVSGVTKRFGGLIAVDAVSFALEYGTLTSLIGPNGAGKTTLFNAMSGIGRVNTGTIRIAGTPVTGWAPHRIARLGVGRTFQNARLFDEMTVLENVVASVLALTRVNERAANDRARETLARLGLEHLSTTYAMHLPFGERRRVELARAIAADPWLLLVDEPAAGLNARERTTLQQDLLAIRGRGVTILLIEHDMKLVMSISDRVMVLQFGKMIADGTAGAIRNDPLVAAAYLGIAS